MKNQDLYQNLIEVLMELIPEKWDKILLSSEVDKEASSVYFFYIPSRGGPPVYSLDVEEKFPVNKDSYMRVSYQLTKTIREVWADFKNQSRSGCKQMTFIVDKSGKFSVDCSYEDLSGDPVENQRIWKEKYLEGC